MHPTSNNSALFIRLMLEKILTGKGYNDKYLTRLKKLAGLKWALRTDPDTSKIKVDTSRYGELVVTFLN